MSRCVVSEHVTQCYPVSVSLIPVWLWTSWLGLTDYWHCSTCSLSSCISGCWLWDQALDRHTLPVWTQYQVQASSHPTSASADTHPHAKYQYTVGSHLTQWRTHVISRSSSSSNSVKIFQVTTWPQWPVTITWTYSHLTTVDTHISGYFASLFIKSAFKRQTQVWGRYVVCKNERFKI